MSKFNVYPADDLQLDFILLRFIYLLDINKMINTSMYVPFAIGLVYNFKKDIGLILDIITIFQVTKMSITLYFQSLSDRFEYMSFSCCTSYLSLSN